MTITVQEDVLTGVVAVTLPVRGNAHGLVLEVARNTAQEDVKEHAEPNVMVLARLNA